MKNPASYRLIRSGRRTLALEVNRRAEVILRAPYYASQTEIDQFFKAHSVWLAQALEKVKKRIAASEISPERERELKALAKAVLPEKVAYYSRQMGLIPSAVKITSAETRFGSCSGKNSLCFSWRLMDYQEAAVDYVVVHELAHIRHKNHGKAFYALIESILPDYRERMKLLKR